MARSSHYATSTAANKSAALWLKNPWFDLIGMAFCWVPFYLWLVWGLDLGGPLPQETLARRLTFQNLSLAIVVVLGATYVHRHYTLLLVYGDQQIRTQRIREYIVLPFIIIAFVYWAKVSDWAFSWKIIVMLAATWNIWHVIMQRYGILRAYAGRAKGGLEQRSHGRRDFWLLWSLVAVMICLTALLQQPAFASLARAKTLMQVLPVLEHSPLLWLLPSLVVGCTVIMVIQWLRYELQTPHTLKERLPRWIFLSSTLALLSIFLIHGPVVGYLCFGMAHAVEYIAFVHLYGEGKYPRASEQYGIAARLFDHPLKKAPLLIAALLLAYYQLSGI